MRTLAGFFPVAPALTLTPGVATDPGRDAARAALTNGPWLRCSQRPSACVLIRLGPRLALERR